MKLRTSASLMIAVVLGLVTAYVGIDVLKKAKGGAATSTKIVVAARDMEPGYVVEATDLKLEEVAAALVPGKSFKDPKLVAGRTVLASVVRGYPLLDNQLAAAGAGAGMQAMVPRGMRAVAVEVSEGSAVAGLITPGCFVDVIATFNRGDQQIATTVVQNVKIQFVQRAKPPRSSGSGSTASASLTAGSPDAMGAVKTVTLIVTPKQANAIELANNQGKPRLVLRGNSDENDMEDATVKQNELVGLPDQPPAPVVVEPPVAPPAPPAVVAAVVEKPVKDAFEDTPPVPVVNKRTVQMIKGGAESMIYFELDGDRSFEEAAVGTPANASHRPKQPATRPLENNNSKKSEGGGEPRTASGASPGEPAPRTEAVRGNLRKGM
ncbi:MAG: pilus assembly protein CpaB [Phycisphaerales bacterium]|jgi:pilus assembly protein CpaB|nr:pilus assembly protein CpaB [Phycisphaerales bacterium]